MTKAGNATSGLTRAVRELTDLPGPRGLPLLGNLSELDASLTFFSSQGEEPVLIKVGTAYESATRHRFAPPLFGPVGR